MLQIIMANSAVNHANTNFINSIHLHLDNRQKKVKGQKCTMTLGKVKSHEQTGRDKFSV